MSVQTRHNLWNVLYYQWISWLRVFIRCSWLIAHLLHMPYSDPCSIYTCICYMVRGLTLRSVCSHLLTFPVVALLRICYMIVGLKLRSVGSHLLISPVVALLRILCGCGPYTTIGQLPSPHLSRCCFTSYMLYGCGPYTTISQLPSPHLFRCCFTSDMLYGCGS